MIHLDERLSMLAALTPACPVAADIGADHGFLGAWLIQSGRCGRVQFLDISAQSLMKARRLIDRLGLAPQAYFGVGDGALAMNEPAQAVIISGMGAETIAGILERGSDRLRGADLILQPNLDADWLRGRLQDMGYAIYDEALCRAGGRWYVGMAARRGEARCTPQELLAGPILMKKCPDRVRDYARFRLRVLRKAFAGARKGDEARSLEIAGEIKRWEEIEKWPESRT